MQSKDKLGLSDGHTKELLQMVLAYGKAEMEQGISFMGRAAQVNILQRLARYNYLEGKRNYILELNDLENEILRQRDEIVKNLPKSPKQKVPTKVMVREIEMGRPLQEKLAKYWDKVMIP